MSPTVATLGFVITIREALRAWRVEPRESGDGVALLLSAAWPGDGWPDRGRGVHDGGVATLRSVNVGRPRTVLWRGRSVFTGIWKSPVDGPVTARRLNLDGDGQGDLGGHGGEQRAVFVYQLGSYRYWEQFLGRDDLVPGQFGENFTVDGLPDDEVCVGDRFAIGTALFEVTQPRVTCYRVGIRLDDPRMPDLLVRHRRPGFYLRVLREGEVRAGDDIVKVADGPEALTVAEVDALLYLPGHPREGLERALRVPALSPGWQTSFRAMLTQPAAANGNAGLAAAAPPPAWAGFRALRVAAVEPESATITSISLADPDGTPLPAALPGQFLTVRVGAGLVRSYSLSGPPGAARYRISVKREGAASGYLHTRVRPGDLIDTAAPRGTFVLGPGSGPVLLISGGVGATPVLAMLHALAATAAGREVWWVQAARDGAERPFATEAAGLLARLPGSRSYVGLSRPRPSDRLGVDYDGAGRLTADVLRSLRLPAGAEAYLCGPAGFLTDVTAALATVGVPADRVHAEVFGARPGLTPGIGATPARPPHPPADEPGAGPAVTFARSDLTVRWPAGPSGPSGPSSLLDLAEACDVPVRWSCRVGVCHTCETGLVSGDVTYATEPVDPPADGDVLLCSARPDGDVVLDL